MCDDNETAWGEPLWGNEEYKLPSALKGKHWPPTLKRDMALGIMQRSIKPPHAAALFGPKRGENITASQAINFPDSQWMLVHVSKEYDRNWKDYTPASEHEKVAKALTLNIGKAIGLIEFGAPIPAEEANANPKYSGWVRTSTPEQSSFFCPRLRFIKFLTPIDDIKGQTGIVRCEKEAEVCARLSEIHERTVPTKLPIVDFRVGASDRFIAEDLFTRIFPTSAVALEEYEAQAYSCNEHDWQVNEFLCWKDNPAWTARADALRDEYEIGDAYFAAMSKNDCDNYCAAINAVRDQFLENKFTQVADRLPARFLHVKPVNAEQEITMIKYVPAEAGKKRGHYEKFIENRQKWYPSPMSEIQHLKVEGINACKLAKVAEGVIHLGAGAEDDESEDRKCVQDCFHLLGHTSVILPEDTVMCSLPAKLGNKFQFFKPSRWGFPVDTCQLTDAIPQLIAHATAKQQFILQVHLAHNNYSLHCVCIKGRQICDPSFKEWIPLSLESFTKLSIDKIVKGFLIVRK